MLAWTCPSACLCRPCWPSHPRHSCADSVAGGLAFEPKWDGFRCIACRDGDQVELASRGSKPLTRYFPEVVRAVLEYLPQRCAIDAEIVVARGPARCPTTRLEALSQRIHPADSRVQRLAEQTPAELICFDILALGDQDSPPWPSEAGASDWSPCSSSLPLGAPLHLTRTTTDAATARVLV